MKSRDARKRALEALVGQSGGRLQSFFFEFELREAFDRLPSGHSREARIHDALAEAERRGILGQVLDEALHRYGGGPPTALRTRLATVDALIKEVGSLPHDLELSTGLQTKVSLILEELLPGEGYRDLVDAIKWQQTARQRLNREDPWPQAHATLANILQAARESLIRRETDAVAVQEERSPMDDDAARRNVFLVHGRDTSRRDAMADFLRSLSLWVLPWEEARAATGQPNPYIGSILEAGLAMTHATVILFSGDDLAQLRPELARPNEPRDEVELMPQPRPNVLFEAGMAMALRPERTVIASIGDGLRPLSDLSGRHIVHMDNSPEKRNLLAQRLGDCGCPVNTKGSDWLTAGRFI